MKSIKKRIALLLVLCLAVTGVFVFAPVSVNADGGFITKKYAKKVTVSTGWKYYHIDMRSKLKGAKKITIKSSKKAVAKVDKSVKKYGPMVQVKKPGTAKITTTVKKGKKTKKYTTKLKVVKYQNPFKSATLAGKSFKGLYKKGISASEYFGEVQGKMVIKPRKGWKVKKIREEITVYDDNGDVDTKFRTIKNNSTTINLADGNEHAFVITMYKKKANLTEQIFLYTY